jgi:uncharacterized protein (DUF885 family)
VPKQSRSLHRFAPIDAGGATRFAVSVVVALALWVGAGASYCAETPADRARAIFSAYYEWELRERPTLATALGDHRYDDRLTDFSEAAIARRKAAVADFARQLRGVDRSALAGQDRVSYDVLAALLAYAERRAAVFAEPDAQGADLWLSVNALDGPQIGFMGLPQIIRVSRFESVVDYENFARRLGAVPGQISQLESGLRRAVAKGWLPPRAVVVRVPEQIDALLVDDLDANPILAPFRRFPEHIAAADRQRLAALGRAVLRDRVLPAFRELRVFYVSEYLPACTDAFAAASRPSWPEAYAAAVASQTTTSLTPAQIHALGLKEVARIAGEMDALVQRIGFKGTRRELAKWLESAPEMHYATGAEMLSAYRDIAMRVEPELPRLFAELPRLPFGIRAMDAAEGDNAEHYTRGAADGTRAGYFEANVNNVARRSKADMVTLLLHEGVPGHHLQVSRALELKGLPAFRRTAFLPAYGEGWALYAESLGDELGVYADPYAKFGYLASEMFRACRLVVDTGIHAFGWTRDRAIGYLVDNAGLPEATAVAEVDRYYVLPGQALAYKIGELKIKALRAKARAELGDRFDIRRFHNALIDDGPLPLSVLEQRIGAWIARNRR